MLKVMVVEDERIIRQGVVNLVKRCGGSLAVHWECESAYQAWEAFQFATPDIVITDIIMKGMTGLALIQRIRESGSEVPIVVLSGFSEFSYAKTALRYNVVDYLLKPVDIKEFSEVLERIRTELEPGDRPEQEDVDNAAVRRAAQWIDGHLSGDLSQQEVAGRAGVTGAYLSVLFKRHMGINYSEYILRRRMEKAEELLKTTHFCIYEITRLVGYHSDKHFINIFKRHTGLTPSQYRNLGR